ncbi:uncharacterized protein LOC128263691 isoform X2 [Drosophila gunungcola]|uniref:uncharacterized protein LOC128263691 isoform X2 n=1 Tax=Drosophila gunungcola TaxID=103775 RepID=UPI0022E9071A|nr:uncharacterized protein LOC128263691 isoform X2 [Drosophila gunungcola]
MPKVTYKQNFRDSWLNFEEFKQWLRKAPTDSTKAYCCFCKVSIGAKLFEIRQHAQAKKHIACIASVAQNHTIHFGRQPTKTEEQEVALCLYIAEHSAIAPIDHLSQLCVKQFKACDATVDIKLKRTKCTHIINDVLGVHFEDDLRKDIGKSKFSLLLDESTDISVTKLLGIVIIYYSLNSQSMITTFLSLVPIQSGDAKTIAAAVKMELSNLKLDILSLIGIGTDNASVMTGGKQSVYTELRKSVPSLILIKCVCHSIQLAVSQSTKKNFPDQLEYIVADTYSWFAKSSYRQMLYKKVYECLNNGQAPLKILKVSDTRWLSIESAVSRIEDQWEELKLHFALASTNESCHKAKILNMLFEDDKNRLYFIFLKPVLKNMQILNKLFQSEQGDSSKLLNEIILAINALGNLIIPPDANIDIFKDDLEDCAVNDLYMGYAFEKEIKDEKYFDEKYKIREDCKNFIKALIIQLRERLPDNIEVLKQMDIFAVGNMLQANKTPDKIISLLEHQYENIDEIVSQFGKNPPY